MGAEAIHVPSRFRRRLRGPVIPQPGRDQASSHRWPAWQRHHQHRPARLSALVLLRRSGAVITIRNCRVSGPRINPVDIAFPADAGPQGTGQFAAEQVLAIRG
jgi:hypothetical protein